MFNPHPPLSSFPFCIVSLLIVLECYSFIKHDHTNNERIKDFLLLSLLLFSILTFVSGYFGVDFADKDIPQELIDNHQNFAKLILLTNIPLLLLRYLSRINNRLKAPYYFILLVIVALIITTSNLGGKLVFEQGAGVTIKRNSKE
ncbi:MAG: hypothetical protein KBC84_03370 [Proteobacteria bacterium]|nr:hypothetical protein [Pseudomonadota bacterium]